MGTISLRACGCGCYRFGIVVIGIVEGESSEGVEALDRGHRIEPVEEFGAVGGLPAFEADHAMQVVKEEITQQEVDQEVQALIEGIGEAGQAPDRGVRIAGMGAELLQNHGARRIGIVEYSQDTGELIEHLMVMPDELVLLTNVFKVTDLNQPADYERKEDRGIGVAGKQLIDR